MGEVKSSYDSLIAGLVIGGLEAESEGVIHIYPVWRSQDQTCTFPWALAAPSTDNLQMGRSGVRWVASVDAAGVNSMMKSTRICHFIVVLCLYLMSNSLSSIDHFISLPEVYGLCSICFIGYSIGTLTI